MNTKKAQKKKAREKRIKKEKNIRNNNRPDTECTLCANGIEHQHQNSNTFIESL